MFTQDWLVFLSEISVYSVYWHRKDGTWKHNLTMNYLAVIIPTFLRTYLPIRPYVQALFEYKCYYWFIPWCKSELGSGVVYHGCIFTPVYHWAYTGGTLLWIHTFSAKSLVCHSSTKSIRFEIIPENFSDLSFLLSLELVLFMSSKSLLPLTTEQEFTTLFLFY